MCHSRILSPSKARWLPTLFPLHFPRAEMFALRRSDENEPVRRILPARSASRVQHRLPISVSIFFLSWINKWRCIGAENNDTDLLTPSTSLWDPARVYEISRMLLELNVLILSDVTTINKVCSFAEKKKKKKKNESLITTLNSRCSLLALAVVHLSEISSHDH